MNLKKIKEKNPGFEFSATATRKATKTVMQHSLKSKLTMNSYQIKYADQVTANKDAAEDSAINPVKDKKWKYLKKISTNENKDFLEEPKASLFNEEGEEVAAED